MVDNNIWLVVKKPSWRIRKSMGRMTSHNMKWNIKNVPKQQPAFLFSWQVLFRKFRPTQNHRMYHMSQFGLSSIKFLRQLGKLKCSLPTSSKSNQLKPPSSAAPNRPNLRPTLRRHASWGKGTQRSSILRPGDLGIQGIIQALKHPNLWYENVQCLYLAINIYIYKGHI